MLWNLFDSWKVEHLWSYKIATEEWDVLQAKLKIKFYL